MEPLRILVADDHEVVRRGVRALLESQRGWRVCAEASEGRDAIAKARKAKPDLAVVDVSMPGCNGLEATRAIRSELPDCEVLVLTMHDSEEVIREVFASGARGYVLKSDAGRDLVSAVRSLRKRNVFITPKLTQAVIANYTRGGDRPASSSQLTPRQRQIVQLLSEGKSNKEIASALGVSVRTAETHRANIMRRLEIHSMSELVRYAIRNQIIQP